MSVRVPPLRRDDIAPDVVAQLRALFPRADRFFAEGGEALNSTGLTSEKEQP